MAMCQRGQQNKIKLSHQDIQDLSFWGTLTMQASLHNEAVDVCFVATLDFKDMRLGRPVMYCDQGIWTWGQRGAAITHHERKVVRVIISRLLGSRMQERKACQIIQQEDNFSVVYKVNSLLSSNPAMMTEMRRLQWVLDWLGILIKLECLPSAMKSYADAISRRLYRLYLPILPQLRRSIVLVMSEPQEAFPYRPLWKPPFTQRRYKTMELER